MTIPTTTYDQFLPEVLPYAHGCADVVGINAIRSAAIEFCERSDYWTYQAPAITGVASQIAYTPTLPSDTVMGKVLDAWYADYPIAPASPDELRVKYRTNWQDQPPSTPAFVTSLTPGEVMLVPAPSVADGSALNLLLSLRPSRASTTVATIIYERWAEVIGFGARAKLYGAPSAAYADAGAAVLYQRRFRAGIADATLQRLRGLGRGADVPHFNRFV